MRTERKKTVRETFANAEATMHEWVEQKLKEWKAQVEERWTEKLREKGRGN